MQKQRGQLTTLWWMEENATAAADLPGAFSLAKLTADLAGGTPKMLHITDAVRSPYTLNPTASDTDDTQMQGDTGNSKTAGLYNYEAKFQFAREKNPAVNTTSIYEKVLALFQVRGKRGYFIRRMGYAKTVALAVGQKLEPFYVESFSPRTLDSDKGKPIWLEVNFGPQGLYLPPTAIIA